MEHYPFVLSCIACVLPAAAFIWGASVWGSPVASVPPRSQRFGDRLSNCLFRLKQVAAVAVLVACCFADPAIADPQGPPTIAAAFVEQGPLLDGNLDDPCWQQAARLTGFYDIDANEPAPEELQVTAYLACDDRNIYFGFHLADPRPDLIQALQRKRGGGVLE